MAMITKRNRGRAVGGSAAMAAVAALGYRADAVGLLDGTYRVEVWQIDPEMMAWVGPRCQTRDEAVRRAMEAAEGIYGIVRGLAAEGDKEY